MLKTQILLGICIILLCSLTYADNYDQNSTFTPTESNVTYNLTRYLDCNSITVKTLCFNITGGPEPYNYCNTSATPTTIQILAPPIIDTYEPTTNPVLNDLSNYSFNITWHDADEYANIDWYMNETNQTSFWNYTTFNTSIIVSVGEYNITVVVSDNNGSTYKQWIISNVTNVAPNITNPEPTTDVNITETESYSFNVTVSDDDVGDTLAITWYVNGTNQTTFWNYTTYNFTANMTSSGDYNITIELTDGTEIVTFQFNLTVTDVTYDAAGGGTAGPPGSTATAEDKCGLLGGVWLLAPEGTYYCKIVSKPVSWVYNIGKKIWPSDPVKGFVGGCIVLVCLLIVFGAVPKWAIFVKDKEKDDKNKRFKRVEEAVDED